MLIKFLLFCLFVVSFTHASEHFSTNPPYHLREPIDFRTYATLKNPLPPDHRRFLTYTSIASTIKLKIFKNCTDHIRVVSIDDFELLQQIANQYNIATAAHNHIIQFSRIGAASFCNLTFHDHDDSNHFSWTESPPQNSPTPYSSFSHVCLPLLNVLTSLTQEILTQSTEQAKTLYRQHHRTAENASDFLVSEANIFNDGGHITINLTDILKPAGERAVFYFAPTHKKMEDLITKLPTNDCITYYIIGYKDFSGIYNPPTLTNQHIYFELIPSLEYIATRNFVSLGMALISKGSLTIQSQGNIVLFSPHVVVLDIFHCISNKKYFLLNYQIITQTINNDSNLILLPLFSIKKTIYDELKAAGITTIRYFHHFIGFSSLTVGFHLIDPHSTNPERNTFIFSQSHDDYPGHLI